GSDGLVKRRLAGWWLAMVGVASRLVRLDLGRFLDRQLLPDVCLGGAGVVCHPGALGGCGSWSGSAHRWYLPGARDPYANGFPGHTARGGKQGSNRSLADVGKLYYIPCAHHFEPADAVVVWLDLGPQPGGNANVPRRVVRGPLRRAAPGSRAGAVDL